MNSAALLGGGKGGRGGWPETGRGICAARMPQGAYVDGLLRISSGCVGDMRSEDAAESVHWGSGAHIMAVGRGW